MPTFQFNHFKQGFHKKLKDKARILVIAEASFDMVPQDVTWNQSDELFYLPDGLQTLTPKQINYWSKIYDNDDILDRSPKVLNKKEQLKQERRDAAITEYFSALLEYKKLFDAQEAERDKDRKKLNKLFNKIRNGSGVSNYISELIRDDDDMFSSTIKEFKEYVSLTAYKEWEKTQEE